MSYENHINKFANAAAIQTAIDNGDLVKPYVALDASAGTIDYNTRSITPDPCEGYSSQEECECVEGGGTWDGSECVYPVDCATEWQERGYESYEDCRCAEYGECPEPPVATMGEWSVDSEGLNVFTALDNTQLNWTDGVYIGQLNGVYLDDGEGTFTGPTDLPVYYGYFYITEYGWFWGFKIGDLEPHKGEEGEFNFSEVWVAPDVDSLLITQDNDAFTFTGYEPGTNWNITTVNPPYPE